MKSLSYSLLLLLALLLACAPSEKDTQPVKSSEKQITDFRFTKTLNSALASDVTATLLGDHITASLPAGMNVSTLKASFSASPKAIVTVSGIWQESGVTANDFSKPVIYQVAAEDGSVASYTVTVQASASSEKEVLSFSFQKANNPSLNSDVTASLEGDQLIALLPTGSDITALKATFTLSAGATARMNNSVQQSGSTVNNFSNPLLCEIVAADGSKKEYKVLTSLNVPSIDNVVTSFMQKYGVPGLSIGIARNGKLVFTKGYGLANQQTKERVHPRHLFRVASVSKPITAVAVMKLVQEGKLSLDRTVFGANGILGTQYGSQPYKTNVDKITVRHLLQHTAGGWNNRQNDPMFQVSNLNQEQLISQVLDTRPLDNVPGMVHDYSNFGYCLLGRIIEKVSGKPYDQYLKESILGPLGISDMHIAGNTLAERKGNEVLYYQANFDPYSMPISRMDAHGGWIASPQDLLRIATAVDGFTTRPDLLSSTSIQTMVQPSNTSPNYALGWAVNQFNNWWHDGSLPGTASILVRTSGGFCWAVVLNTRNNTSAFASDLDNMVWQAVNGTSSWPAYDLFEN